MARRSSSELAGEHRKTLTCFLPCPGSPSQGSGHMRCAKCICSPRKVEQHLPFLWAFLSCVTCVFLLCVTGYSYPAFLFPIRDKGLCLRRVGFAHPVCFVPYSRSARAAWASTGWKSQMFQNLRIVEYKHGVTIRKLCVTSQRLHSQCGGYTKSMI